MTTSKGLGISIKYGDQSREMELSVNQHALGVRVPQGDNLRLALLRKWRRMGETISEIRILGRFGPEGYCG
jgi:hypothetical protein